MTAISDPDVKLLATYASLLHEEYSGIDQAWDGSPFAWILSLPSRSKGAIGEKLVSGFLATKGFDVTRSPDSEADRIINGTRAEIKCSTLWKSGQYKFQQLRDQNYKYAICLGISPFDAHCWVLPKDVIMSRWRSGEIHSQHGGSEGTDTAWLSLSPAAIPSWMDAYGGRLGEAINLLEKFTGLNRI